MSPTETSPPPEQATQHTPGPWRWRGSRLTSADDRPVAWLDADTEVAPADAALIVAAPDILEEADAAAAWLREHARFIDPTVRQGYDGVVDGLEAVLAKAAGRALEEARA